MAAQPATHQSTFPTRAATNSSIATDDDDLLPSEDSSEATKLFAERLRAWKHAVGYLEDYVEATDKLHHHQHKEYEKVVKTVSSPLKEAETFESQPGGLAGLLENLRGNTQNIANSNLETSKTLKGQVLPIFSRLHDEIKHKTKELTKGAGRGSKAVDKARQATQKEVESLGANIGTLGSSGGKLKAADDPYITQRGVYHKLHKQVTEENNNRADMIEVQNTFAQFEAHILKTIQTGLNQFQQVLFHQSEQNKVLYGDITNTSNQIAPDFEWNSFMRRKNDVLIDPSAPPRSVSNIAFPHQNHASTQPMIAGALDRKGKLLKKYETAYYVITPAKYLHQFKNDDMSGSSNPSPETSLYLPDCLVGALDGQKFAVKGKDASGGVLSLSMSHEYQFKAATPADAAKWYEVIQHASGGVDTSIKTERDDSTDANAAVAPAAAHQPVAANTVGTAPVAGTAGGFPSGEHAAVPAATTVPTTTSAPMHSSAAVPAGTATTTGTVPTSATTTGTTATGIPPQV